MSFVDIEELIKPYLDGKHLINIVTYTGMLILLTDYEKTPF